PSTIFAHAPAHCQPSSRATKNRSLERLKNRSTKSGSVFRWPKEEHFLETGSRARRHATLENCSILLVAAHLRVGVTYGLQGVSPHMSRQIELKTNAQMAKMHEAGLILHQGLDAVVAAAKPGVTTKDLDQVFRKVLADNGATSNFLGYYGFPATICASVNDEVVHGIPGDRVLQEIRRAHV